MNQSDPLWSPDPEQIAASLLTDFMRIASEKTALDLSRYADLYQWSIDEKESFWSMLWDFSGVIGEKGKTVDHDYLCKLVDNLIQNACRYAQQILVISCRWDDNRFYLSVEDDGQGVAEDQVEKIFKPFYRAKEQSVKKSSGFGLGLAIVKRIVQWHAGRVQVSRSAQLGGARFE